MPIRITSFQYEIVSEDTGFPHSEIPGSESANRLPEAYRRLQRPSSPSTAKAFTRCASSLDHITGCPAETEHPGKLDRDDDLIRQTPMNRSHGSRNSQIRNRIQPFLAFLFAVNHLIPELLKIKNATIPSRITRCHDIMVEPRRIELLTCCVQSNRSPS